jgi:hypothetical protein
MARQPHFTIRRSKDRQFYFTLDNAVLKAAASIREAAP